MTPLPDERPVEIRIIGTQQQVDTVAPQIEALFAQHQVSGRTYPSRDGRVRYYIRISLRRQP